MVCFMKTLVDHFKVDILLAWWWWWNSCILHMGDKLFIWFNKLWFLFNIFLHWSVRIVSTSWPGHPCTRLSNQTPRFPSSVDLFMKFAVTGVSCMANLHSKLSKVTIDVLGTYVYYPKECWVAHQILCYIIRTWHLSGMHLL